MYQVVFFLVLSFIITGCSYKQDSRSDVKIKDCNFLPDKQEPFWINSPAAISNKLYFGIAQSSYQPNSSKQIKHADNQAILNLVSQVSSIVNKEEIKKIKRIRNNKSEIINSLYKSDSNIKSSVLLKGFNVKNRWLDRKSCIVWSLVTVHKKQIDTLQTKLNNQISLLNKINQYVINARDLSKNYKSRKRNIEKALLLFDKSDQNLLSQIETKWLSKPIQEYYQEMILLKNMIETDSKDILKNVYINMFEDDLLEIIKPKKNSFVFSYGDYEKIDSIKHDDKFIILENYYVKCIVHQDGFKYKKSDDGYNRVLTQSCNWHLDNKKKYVLKY